MSERQAKKRRRALRAAGIEPKRTPSDTVDMNNIGEYLLNIMKRYPGWSFISISKPGCMCVGNPKDDKSLVPIQVHKLLPCDGRSWAL